MFFLDSAAVISKLEAFITEERRQKIDRVLQSRIFDKQILLEDIYDRGNISAVMRSADAFGVFRFQICDVQKKYKVSSRVTQGAERWLQVQEWDNTGACVEALKKQGFKVAVTSLAANASLESLDFSQPLVFAFGNERDGVSQELLEMADYRFKIPMYGFTQSFNISVAAALCLQKIREKHSPQNAVSDKDYMRLKALYYYRAYEHSARLFEAEGLRHSSLSGVESEPCFR